MKKLLLLLAFSSLLENIFAQSDYSSSAPAISVNSSCAYQQGTLLNATQSIAPISCPPGLTSPAALDVWYKFVATASTQTITVVPSINVNAVIDLRDGAPGNNIACSDASSNGGVGGTETLIASGLTICNTYYIRIYNNGSSTTTNTFDICVTGAGNCSGCVLTGVTPTINSPGTGSSPGQTINTTTPTLSWNAVSGANMYGVYVRDMISNTLVVNNDCATSSTSFTVPSGILSNNGQYRWNIIGYDACNGTCKTNAASPLYFQVQTSSCVLSGVTPTINSPGSSSSPGPTVNTKTPTLSWNAVSGANMYGVYVRDMVSNTLVVNNDCATSGTSYTVSSGILSNNGQYRWNIIGYDACSSACATNGASPLYFQVCDLSSVTPSLNPLSNITSSTMDVSWIAVPNATSYAILYNSSSVNNITGTNYTLTGLSSCTLYTVLVIAQDGNCYSQSSNSQQGTTIGCTGIAEQSNDSFFLIYPNPSTGKFSIESKIPGKEYELSIATIFGETILSQKISVAKYEINLSDYPMGIYFLQLKSEEKIFNTTIIVE